MSHFRFTISVLAMAGLALVAGATVAAQGMAGLVLEVTGAPAPPIKPFREIPPGAVISLASGATMTFVHYQTCRAVSVSAGTVTVRSDDYTIVGGSKVEEQRPCPRPVSLRRGGETAGIVLRGGEPPPAILPPRPTFVIVGARADTAAKVRIARDTGETVLEAPVEGRQFVWPHDVAPLAPDATYDLNIVFEGSTIASARLRFVVERPGAVASPAPLTLIRAD
jgi:hypothetical protein